MPIKFNSYNIVLQEIPNEITLAFEIIGCKLNCKGCHSQHLWDTNKGEVLTDEILLNLLDKYENTISCVLFMGGEWTESLLSKIELVKSKGLKVALYTGLTEKQVFKKYPSLLDKLDFIKYGRWVEELGGLKSVITNQLLMDLKTKEILNKYFISPLSLS